jgi:hypothetical protein
VIGKHLLEAAGSGTVRLLAGRVLMIPLRLHVPLLLTLFEHGAVHFLHVS